MLGILPTSLILVALSAVQEQPPGLLLVKGGKTKVGTDPNAVEKLVLDREEAKGILAGETPLHTVDVDDFFLMPTEVTNEQYRVYVKATRSKPPQSWGLKAVQAAQADFVVEQGKAKQAARAEGKPFELKVFDPEEWWSEHWKESEWEVPAGTETHPVVFVNYREAQLYAHWAGLRLPTELEFQRAARGDSARIYPWGDDWDDRKYCQSLSMHVDQTAPVGSFEAGAVNGFYDLAGNVWEWTASPYLAFPGYKPLSFNVKNPKRTIECIAPFDPNMRVTVSGSYQNDSMAMRAATRMCADRGQSTSGLGFRCAASKLPGLDAATWILAENVRKSVIGPDAELIPQRAFVLQRWQSEPGTVKTGGYAMITSHEQVLACPRGELRASTPSDLAATSLKEGPLFIGFIDVPVPLVEPELDAGSYLVAWRGAGKVTEAETEEKQGMALGAQEGASEIPYYEMPGFTADKDCFFFYTCDGAPQVAVPAPPVSAEKMRDVAIAIEPFVPPVKPPKDAPPPKPLDTVRFTISVQSAVSRSKGLIFNLPVRIATGSIDTSWK